MSAELTKRKNGFIEFASRELIRREVWHGLGQYLSENASIDEWVIQSGLDWSIRSSALMYQGIDGIITNEERQILHRSDDSSLLGIVSDGYKVVQPKQVLEFFRAFVENNQMKLSAAGSLFGGKKFWATADVGKDFEVTYGDKIKAYLLLMSSADGSTSTIAKFCSTRVVCNNTLQIALSENSNNVIKVSHSSMFDPTKIKVDLGLIDQAWENFMGNMRKLVDVKVDDEFALDFYARLITPAQKEVDLQMIRTQRHVDAMMHFYKNGAGADMSHGTAYGVLQGVTEAMTHGTGRTNRSIQFESSETGYSANMKSEALKRLMAFAA